MKRCHVAALKIFPALETEAFHAKCASQMIAIPRFLNHLIAIRAHLYRLSFCRFIIQTIEVILARLTSVPAFFSQIAKFVVARRALYLIIVFLLKSQGLRASRVLAVANSPVKRQFYVLFKSLILLEDVLV